MILSRVTWGIRELGANVKGEAVWLLSWKNADIRSGCQGTGNKPGLWVSWTARRSNQSILKEISPEYSLEGLMLKLKCQYHLATWSEELTPWKRPWCWERLKAGGEGDDRGLDGWTASLTWWTWVWASSGSWWRTGKPGVLGSQRVGHDWTTELNVGHPRWDLLKVQKEELLSFRWRLEEEYACFFQC